MLILKFILEISQVRLKHSSKNEIGDVCLSLAELVHLSPCHRLGQVPMHQAKASKWNGNDSSANKIIHPLARMKCNTHTHTPAHQYNNRVQVSVSACKYGADDESYASRRVE